jgi:hypothetical protein
MMTVFMRQTLQRFPPLHIVKGLPPVKTLQLYINGEFVEPHAKAAIDVIDPSTTEVIGRVPDADAGRRPGWRWRAAFERRDATARTAAGPFELRDRPRRAPSCRARPATASRSSR